MFGSQLFDPYTIDVHNRESTRLCITQQYVNLGYIPLIIQIIFTLVGQCLYHNVGDVCNTDVDSCI